MTALDESTLFDLDDQTTATVPTCVVCQQPITRGRGGQLTHPGECGRIWKSATHRARTHGTDPIDELARLQTMRCRVCGEGVASRERQRDICEPCAVTGRAKAYRDARRAGLDHETALVASLPVAAVARDCLDCGQPVPWDKRGQCAHRCPSCIPIHQRAVARAKRTGRTIEQEKARALDPRCDTCGTALPDVRRRRCPTCSVGHRRASWRAWRYGTDVAAERARQATCRICGEPAARIDGQWCQPCTESGRVKVYRRARGHYQLDHDTATILSAAVECAICARPLDRTSTMDTGLTSAAHIDHCHAGTDIRGVLCGQCNRGLGMFRDDMALLARAIAYLDGERTVVTGAEGEIRSVGFAAPARYLLDGREAAPLRNIEVVS